MIMCLRPISKTVRVTTAQVYLCSRDFVSGLPALLEELIKYLSVELSSFSYQHGPVGGAASKYGKKTPKYWKIQNQYSFNFRRVGIHFNTKKKNSPITQYNIIPFTQNYIVTIVSYTVHTYNQACHYHFYGNGIIYPW